jgi:hypothetical protein
MHPLYNSFTALAVSAIYIAWRAYDQARRLRVCQLHQRVAYMLWVMAGQIN